MTKKQLTGSRICWSSGWFCAYHEEPASACWGERIKKNYQLRPPHHHDSKGHRHRRNVCLCWSEFWRTALISRVWGFPFLENLFSFDTFLWGERTMQPRENHLIDWWLKPKSNTDNGETERTSCCGKTTHLRYWNDASGINTIVTILITKITTRLSHLSHHPLALPRQTLPLLCFLVEGVWSV